MLKLNSQEHKQEIEKLLPLNIQIKRASYYKSNVTNDSSDNQSNNS